MAFTESWVETDPDGSVITVSQLDNFERATKRQVRERLEGDPANLNLSGVFETFGTGAVVKKGVARAFVDTIANIGSYPLQDGRLFIASDTGRAYHLKGSGVVEFQYLPLTGGSTLGGITISTGAAQATLALQTNAGQKRTVQFVTAGSLRWEAYTDSSAESGGNAGSNFFIARYNDAGVFVDNPLQINRASGTITTIGAIVNSNYTLQAIASEGQIILQSTGGGAIGWKFVAQTNDRLALYRIGNGTAYMTVDPSGPVTWGFAQTVSTGDFTISRGSLVVSQVGGAARASIDLRTDAGQIRDITFRTGTAARWQIDTDNSAESGGNVGSNFAINRYTDAGAFIDSPISIIRSTGITTISLLTIANTGVSPLTINRVDAAQNFNGMIVLQRSGVSKGYIALDSADGIALLDSGAAAVASFGSTVAISKATVITSNGAPTLKIQKDASVDNSFISIQNSQASGKIWSFIIDSVANGGSFGVWNASDGGYGLQISPTFVVTIGAAATANVPLIIDRSIVAGNIGLIQLKRQGATKYFIGLDSGDNWAILSSGGAVSILCDASGNFKAGSVINAVTGYQINSGAPSGHYLRGNGTNYVDSTLQVSDLPSPLNQSTFQVNSGAIVSRLLNASLTWNPNAAGIAAGSFANTGVTVTGAQVGDMVWVPNPWAIDDSKYIAVGWVSAANTVVVQLMNPTTAAGGATTSRTVKVWVLG